jgi:hypothetical protein
MGRSVVPFFTGIGQPINTVGGEAAAGLTGASGMLRVEPEQLDGAIAVFRGALHALEAEVWGAANDIQALAPANDAVSNDAANAFNRVSYENADSAVAVWEGAVTQLRSIVDQLELSKRAIVLTDTGNASNFQVP